MEPKETQSGLTWQPSLFGLGDEPAIDRSFARLTRIELDRDSWVDHAPGWLSGADALFERVLAGREWEQRSRQMHDQKVREPRLTAPWNLASGEPLEPPILEEIRVVLSERYDREFDSVGFNLYRDGQDSVAWHGDRIPDRGSHRGSGVVGRTPAVPPSPQGRRGLPGLRTRSRRPAGHRGADPA